MARRTGLSVNTVKRYLRWMEAEETPAATGGLDEAGWLKALKLEGYAPRAPRGPGSLQQALFPYADAL
jgi:hypothetical protein